MIANTCIEATARLGMELGYHVTIIKDAIAAFSHGACIHSEVNGPAFAHAMLTTKELLVLLPAQQR
jgi:nicotinamidase-related amidase